MRGLGQPQWGVRIAPSYPLSCAPVTHTLAITCALAVPCGNLTSSEPTRSEPAQVSLFRPQRPLPACYSGCTVQVIL